MIQRLQNKGRFTRICTLLTLTATASLLSASGAAQSIGRFLPESKPMARPVHFPALAKAQVATTGPELPPPEASVEKASPPDPAVFLNGAGQVAAKERADTASDKASEIAPDKASEETKNPLLRPAVPDHAGVPNGQNGHFRWGPALKQSLLFLAVEHGFRLATEPGTRADLKGPFFKDWFESAGNLRGWRDGDPFYVNYVGHAMQGAVSGFIQIQNDPGGVKQKVGWNRDYWRSRRRALWWSTLYSTQFELGPLSESSIGNVGLRPVKTSPHPQAFVDMVITPTVGTAWLVGEDWLDQKLVRRVEGRTDNRLVRLLVRSFLNPGRSFANAMRGKYPWYRDDRKL